MKFTFYKPIAWLLLFGLTFFPALTNAQIFTYTNNSNGVPSTVAGNANGTNLIRVNGAMVPTSPCATGFSSTKFSNVTVFNTDLKAIEFTVAPNPDFQLNIFSLTAGLRRSSTGPALTRFAYSTDGGATWTDEGSNHAPKNSSCGNVLNYTWTIGIASTNAVKLRIYGFNASATSGTLQLLNVTLSGTVTSVSSIDNDGDGFSSNTDCNDNDALIHPGATEFCNGVDDNCDGQTDEGLLQAFYADADNDGFGNVDIGTIACTAPQGYVSNSGDCNDGSSTIYPGAPEFCNTLDDDCDGLVDENALSATIIPEGTITECKNVKVTLSANTGIGIAYTWFRNNVIIYGETLSIYKTKKAGNFKVTETNNFSCTSTSAITKIKRIVCLDKEMEEMTTSPVLQVFPNPNSGAFNVQLQLPGSENEIANVVVMNALGQIIYSRQLTVDNGSLHHELRMDVKDGFYIMRIEVGGQVFISKIICQQ